MFLNNKNNMSNFIDWLKGLFGGDKENEKCEGENYEGGDDNRN